jgi:hypothetical protein
MDRSLRHIVFTFREFLKVLWVGVNYPHVSLGLPDLLALAIELLLIDPALLRPGLLEFGEPALAALEETDGFGVGLLQAL